MKIEKISPGIPDRTLNTAVADGVQTFFLSFLWFLCPDFWFSCLLHHLRRSGRYYRLGGDVLTHTHAHTHTHARKHTVSAVLRQTHNVPGCKTRRQADAEGWTGWTADRRDGGRWRDTERETNRWSHLSARLPPTVVMARQPLLPLPPGAADGLGPRLPEFLWGPSRIRTDFGAAAEDSGSRSFPPEGLSWELSADERVLFHRYSAEHCSLVLKQQLQGQQEEEEEKEEEKVEADWMEEMEGWTKTAEDDETEKHYEISQKNSWFLGFEAKNKNTLHRNNRKH